MIGTPHANAEPQLIQITVQFINRCLRPSLISWLEWLLPWASRDTGSREYGKSTGPIIYRQAQAPPDNYTGTVLELVPPVNSTGNSWPQYRTSLESVEFQSIFMWDPKGIFDIERLPRQADVNRVPLETYFPPIAILRYDDQGHPINPAVELNPTLNPAGYIQSPPLVLTTLDAARAMRGNSAISAISRSCCPGGLPGWAARSLSNNPRRRAQDRNNCH